jgi:methyltransferase
VATPVPADLAATTTLRYWVIATLGDRWCTRVIVVPGAPLVDGGPFRWLRHPNYLAVALEVPALPLVHTAWLTALVFGTLDLAVLRARIRAEDAALGRPRR